MTLEINEPVDLPAPTNLNDAVIGLNEILSSAQGPDINGGIDLTDEEFAAFLEAARS